MSVLFEPEGLQRATDASVDLLEKLLAIPSPTGYTREAIAFLERAFAELGLPGLSLRVSHKGALVMHLPGAAADAPRGLTAHTDTLGAMVREIKPSGRLKLTMIGGSPWPAVENEGVWVRTASNRRIRGSIVPVNGSTHVNRDIGTMLRNEDSMEVRLDERTASLPDTAALGIAVGDFVFFDPRTEISAAGFIRSRFMDDKQCVACIYGALALLLDAGLAGRLPQDVTIVISNYEEVGHGGSAEWPTNLAEYLCVDMAAMGTGQSSDEFSVTLCIKDSSGPYSFELNEKLRALAAEQAITLRTDTYPYYGSDGSVYWRSGGAARVALIGPGVDSSHGYERGHRDGMTHTAHLIAAWLLSD
jgi:putative aminopeptidase FrvX